MVITTDQPRSSASYDDFTPLVFGFFPPLALLVFYIQKTNLQFYTVQSQTTSQKCLVFAQLMDATILSQGRIFLLTGKKS
jgi:hypothetical protein